MKNRIKNIISVLAGALLIFIPSSCFEDHFVEPADPFELERLEPNPAVITLADTTNPLMLETNYSNITEFNGGIRIRGSMFTKHDRFGDIRLTNGDFIFLEEGAAKRLGKFMPSEHGNLPLSRGTFYRVMEDSIQTFSAMAAYGMLNLPDQGILSKISGPFSGGGLLGSKITLGYGSKIKEQASGDYFNPLNDNRYYFVFELETGLSFTIGESDAVIGNALDGGNTTVSAGQSASFKIALDPLDPFFFFRGDMTNMSFGGVSTGGFGFSVQGLINYQRRVEVYDRIKNFDNGYFYIVGDIPLPFPELNPTISDAEAVVRFDPGDYGSQFGFFDLLDVQFKIGCNGTLNLNPDIIPGFLSATITLGNASYYLDWKGFDDFSSSFVGVLDPGQATDPKGFLIDRLQDFLKMMGAEGNEIEFLKYINMPTPTIEQVATWMGTVSSDPGQWEFGFINKMSIGLPVIGEIAAGESRFNWDPAHIQFIGHVDIGGFSGVEMLGEISWLEANFRLMGHAWLEIEESWGPVGFRLAMELLADIYKQESLFGFHGLIYLEGKCWADVGLFTITVGAKLRVEILVESDGSFMLCFEIGIGPLGFDVCIDYSNNGNGMMLETVTMKEIPLEQVPLEHRFQPEDGPVQLPPDYVHDFETVHKSTRLIKMMNQ